MALTKEKKHELVAFYRQLIAESQALFLAEYHGLDVKDMQELRAAVRDADGRFLVTKNTLLSLALADEDIEMPEGLLTGQLATGFAMGEVPAMAKALIDFGDEDEKLTLRAGVLAGNLLSSEQIADMAKLPSLDQLRAQVIGLLNAPAQNLVNVVTGGVRQVVNVIDAYARSGEEPTPAA